MKELNDLIKSQYELYKTGITKDINFRMDSLKKLRQALINNENEIMLGLNKDLGKSNFEAYASEFGMLISAINETIKRLKCWASPKKVKTGIINFPSKGYIYQSPRGVVLIMSPWNYPIYLSILPLIYSIAAGNCSILKTSRYSSYTSIIIQNMIFEIFDTNYIAVLQGGKEENEYLINQKFDFIFFTGSTSVGKIVLTAAAKNLTPVVLELGGKNPCIVTKSANIKKAAMRIAWGKFLNCGQTCIAPDYLLVDRTIKNALVSEIIKNIKAFYGQFGMQSADYGKIINQKHYNRVKDLLNDGHIIYGGDYDDEMLKIAPTIMEDIKSGSPLISQEIFGPILPVIEYTNLNQAYLHIEEYSNETLAGYIFTNKAREQREFITRVSCGGGAINDTIMQLAAKKLPFGGVGASGMGRNNGYEGFKTFSNFKSFLKKSNLMEIKLKYPPYGDKIVKLKKFIK